MKNLNISVAGKVAKYLQRDGTIVCGNSDYQITFTFDAEWDDYPTKIARFIWNGQYWDQPFTGNECPVPIITNAASVTVGVYAGDLSTTTPASIPCKRSILCGDEKIRDINVEACRDEAVAAAENVVDELAKRTQLKPEFANSIEECTDTTKLYVLPDDHIYAYMRIEEKPYINRLPDSTDTDGTVYGADYNGDGKKDGYLEGMCISSGAVKKMDGYDLAGFMRIGAGSSGTARKEQIIYLKNVVTQPLDDYTRIAFYDADKTYLGVQYCDRIPTPDTDTGGAVVVATFGEDGNIASLDVSGFTGYLADKNVTFFRICAPNIDANSIITVNQEITGTSTVTERWADTGHAFVPTEYEEDILDLKETIEKNADDIADLNEKASLQDIEIAEIKANGTTIPDEVKNAVSALVDKAMSREGIRILRFLISSDAHQNNDHDLITKGNKELGQAQGEILNLIGVDFVANLGDVAWGADTNTVAEVVEQIKTYKRLTASALKGECQLLCEGNHDDGNYSLESYPDTPKLTASALNTLLYSEHKGVVYDLAHAVDGYCYKDFEHLKVRVILLNTEQGDGDGGVMADYQLKWLAETALNMSGKTGWQVMTLAHHMVDHGYPSIFIDCVNIIEAFAKKIKLVNNNSSTEYTTRGGTVIKADYSECDCDYIAHFHGHAHAYSVVNMQKYSDSGYADIILPNGKRINEICIPNACFTRSNQYITKDDSDRLKRYTTPTSYEKADVDGQRTSFNLVTVCLDEKIIYADNYGAGIDRVISY